MSNARDRFFAHPESIREAAWDAVCQARAMDPEQFSMQADDEVWEDLAERAEIYAADNA